MRRLSAFTPETEEYIVYTESSKYEYYNRLTSTIAKSCFHRGLTSLPIGIANLGREMEDREMVESFISRSRIVEKPRNTVIVEEAVICNTFNP